MSLVGDKELFLKFYKSLCQFAWQMIRDNDLAEDLAQDAFVSYFQNRDKVSKNEKAIKAFLYSSVKYSVYNLSRKNKTIEKYWQRCDFKDIDDVDYEHQIIRSEYFAYIYKVISSLPRGCSQIMILSYFDGLSNEEIATQLNLSVNTVKTHKKRGLKVLREKLAIYTSVIIFCLFF